MNLLLFSKMSRNVNTNRREYNFNIMLKKGKRSDLHVHQGENERMTRG